MVGRAGSAVGADALSAGAVVLVMVLGRGVPVVFASRRVGVRVRVQQRPVVVSVLVDQVHREQQLAVAQHRGERSVGGGPVVLAQHEDAFDQPLELIELVGGEDDRLAGPVELVEQLDQPLLRARVEAVRGLVQEQDLGVDRKDGGEGDLLLLAAAQIVGRAFGERTEAQHGQGVVDPLEDLLAGQVEVQRPEGDLVAHAGAEELRVRALKDDADAAPEGLGRRLVVQGAVVDAPAEGRDGAAAWAARGRR